MPDETSPGLKTPRVHILKKNRLTDLWFSVQVPEETLKHKLLRRGQNGKSLTKKESLWRKLVIWFPKKSWLLPVLKPVNQGNNEIKSPFVRHMAQWPLGVKYVRNLRTQKLVLVHWPSRFALGRAQKFRGTQICGKIQWFLQCTWAIMCVKGPLGV